jgi:hypothetical protein
MLKYVLKGYTKLTNGLVFIAKYTAGLADQAEPSNGFRPCTARAAVGFCNNYTKPNKVLSHNF